MFGCFFNGCCSPVSVQVVAVSETRVTHQARPVTGSQYQSKRILPHKLTPIPQYTTTGIQHISTPVQVNEGNAVGDACDLSPPQTLRQALQVDLEWKRVSWINGLSLFSDLCDSFGMPHQITCEGDTKGVIKIVQEIRKSWHQQLQDAYPDLEIFISSWTVKNFLEFAEMRNMLLLFEKKNGGRNPYSKKAVKTSYKALWLYLHKRTYHEVEKKSIIRVEYWGNGEAYLTNIPSELFSFSNLQEISIPGNRVRWVSKNIVKLKQLTHLNLEGNELHVVPDSLAVCSALKMVNLQNNPIDFLQSADCLTLLRGRGVSVSIGNSNERVEAELL